MRCPVRPDWVDMVTHMPIVVVEIEYLVFDVSIGVLYAEVN